MSRSPGQTKLPRQLLISCLVALSYFVTAKAGLLLATIMALISPFWPASGLATVVIYLYGWPAVLGVWFGAVLTNTLAGSHVLVAGVIGTGNALEGLVAALILRRFLHRQGTLDPQSPTFAIACAAFFAPLVSASIAVLTLSLVGSIAWNQTFQAWLTWWCGDVVGIILTTPLLLFFRPIPRSVQGWQMLIRAYGLRTLAVLLVTVMALVFGVWMFEGSFIFLAFLPLLFALVWGSGPLVFLSCFSIALGTVWATSMEHGPFADLTLNENLLDLQVVLSALALSALTLHGIGKKNLNRQIVAVLLVGWTLAGLLFYSFYIPPRLPMPGLGPLLDFSHNKYLASQNFGRAWVGALAALLTMSVAQLLATVTAAQALAEREVVRRTQQLVERKRLWKTLMECAPVGIFHADNSGQPLYSNPKWKEITGLSPEDSTQESRRSTLHPDDRERVMESWKISLATLQNFECEYRQVRADGTLYWVQTYAAPIIDEFQQCKGFVGVVLDITARKDQDRQLEAERMRSIHASRMASLGEMAGNIAHEINNPLAIINAVTCEMLMSGEQLSPNVKSGISIIETTTNRIAKIISSLRSFSRNSEFDPFRAVQLEHLVDEVLELCRERFRHQKVELIKGELPHGLIQSRGVQLSQVILNLLSNALDAVLSQAQAWVRIEAEIHGLRLHLSVTDSGQGISQAIISHMMEPFFTTKEFGKGTGLGLSIAQSIAQTHGGQLRYEPLHGHTRFVLEIPFEQTPAPQRG